MSEQLIKALEAAAEWIGRSAHGDNCYVSDHYEGDPGDRCNCGKESIEGHINHVLTLSTHHAAQGAPQQQGRSLSDQYLANEITWNEYCERTTQAREAEDRAAATAPTIKDSSIVAAAPAQCAGSPGECEFNGACMYACGATTPAGGVTALREALQFYANGDHFVKHDPDVWDTVSGEPANLWEDEANSATVEDGSIARTALTTAARAAEPEREVWIVVKEHVWEHGDGGRPTLAYLIPAEFGRQTFPSFDAASAWIRDGNWPLGWVAMKLDLATSPTPPTGTSKEGGEHGA